MTAGRRPMMPLRRRAIMPLAVGLFMTVVPRAAVAQTGNSSAPRIDSIVVITQNVFDSLEAELNPGFKAANALHVKTRPYVVRRELLFKVGEPYDSAQVAETARNLRRFGLFRAVAIDSFRVNGRLVVQVVTRDAWSTSIELNGASTGGTFTWSTGLTEENFLGTGDQLSLGYAHGVDRNTVGLSGGLRRLLGTKAQASGLYDIYSDGHDAGLGISVPFRSYSQRRSLAVNGSVADRRVLRFRDGDPSLTQRWQRRSARGGFIGALAAQASPRGYVRLGLLGQVKHEEYLLARDTVLALPDTVSGTVGIFAEWRRAGFTVVTHYNGFAREEDVDLSDGISLGAWVAPSAFGYGRAGVGPFVNAQAGWPIGASFIKVSAGANGLFTSAGLDSGQVRGLLTGALRVFPRQATVLHIDGGAQRGLAPGSEFDLGHTIGPRYFGPHAFTGDRMLWGTLEHRVYLIDELFNLFGLGFAGFVDYGGAWYADEPARKGGDIGFGLRLGATRATGNNVGRLDIAYGFGDGITGNRWKFSLGRSFSY